MYVYIYIYMYVYMYIYIIMYIYIYIYIIRGEPPQNAGKAPRIVDPKGVSMWALSL